MTKRIGLRTVLAAGTIVAFLGVAGAASAGEAYTSHFHLPSGFEVVLANFEAYAGEKNDVEISRETSPHRPGYDWIEFHDRVQIDARWGWLGSHGCDHGFSPQPGVGVLYDQLFAKCGHWSVFNDVGLDLGDGDDRLRVRPTTPARFPLRITGGDGNDDLDFRDGASGDAAYCGAGIDWAFGDPGDIRHYCENESLGTGVTFESPAVVWLGADALNVFVRGKDNRLWEARSDGQAWSDWERVPGGPTLSSAPAAARWGAGGVSVFARGPDNALWHTWREGDKWSGQWESLGGVLTSAPTVASWGPGRLDVFVRGLSSSLYQRSCQVSQDSVCVRKYWSDWQTPPLGWTLGSAPTAISRGSGQIEVFMRGHDNVTYQASFADGNWRPGWTPLGGQTFEAPAVARLADRLYLFIHGTDGILYRQKFANGSWGGSWEPRGGRNARLRLSPAAVTATNSGGSCGFGTGRTHVFMSGGDRGELHHLRDCTD